MSSEDNEVLDVLERVEDGVNAFDELRWEDCPAPARRLSAARREAARPCSRPSFSRHGITMYRENGVLVTFEEPARDIEANMIGFGWDLVKWRKEGKLAFVDASLPANDELVVGTSTSQVCCLA